MGYQDLASPLRQILIKEKISIYVHAVMRPRTGKSDFTWLSRKDRGQAAPSWQLCHYLIIGNRMKHWSVRTSGAK